jgi:hypothetical protein
MSTPFQQPSPGGDKVPMAELVNSLVLIWVRDYRQGVVTSFGEKDAVACDVHVLDGPHGGEIFDNALLFQGALIGSLKPAVGGDPVLARVGQGVAKPGQNAPWILNPFTDADAQTAMGYIQRMKPPVQQPAAAAPDPTPAAAAAPAAATPSPAAASPTTANVPANLPNGMTAEAFAALPAEVQELIRQSVAA